MLIFTVAILLMILTLLFAPPINGERRWMLIPLLGITVQTSEILKIALVVVTSVALATRQNIIDKVNILPSFSYSNWQKYPAQNRKILYDLTIPILGPVAIAILLVVVNNLSTALMMGIGCFVMLIFGRVKSKELWRLAGVGALMVVLLISFASLTGLMRGSTWINRIERTITRVVAPTDYAQDSQMSDADYQIEQSRIAIASGWKLGKGAGQSSQRSNLPFAYSDYVYAIIIEEYGLIGGVIILLLYMLIFYRTIVIFQRCQDKPFAGMMVLGLGVLITIQALIHILVVTDSFIPTGQPLPIISKGGTSMVLTCTMFGMILGVSRQLDNELKAKKIEEEQKASEQRWLESVTEREGIAVSDESILEGDDSDLTEGGVIWRDE